MIKMNKIKRIIEVALWTGWIENEKPVSLLIVAKPERGKTEALKIYKDNKGIAFINDVTTKALTEILINKYKNKELLNHIIIPDFLNPISKQQSTSKQIVQFLSSLIEDGVCIVKSAYIDLNLDGFQCGLITAITEDENERKKKSWRSIGFLSRFVPVTYSYSFNTILEIFESISKQDYHKHDKINLDFPEKKTVVNLPYELSKDFDNVIQSIAIKQKLDGIRLKKAFNSMLKAIALSKNKLIVDKEDTKELLELCEYINYDFSQVKD